jgi:serine/threonine-protein kinase
MQIGSYQVLFELGRGGMGTVYLGRIVFPGGIERLVAIKRAHPRLSASPEVTERFLNEARLTAHVHHANVVGVHHIGSDDDGHYLVFDYVEGESLAGLCDRIPRTERLPPRIAIRILLDALSGLHAAHETVDSDGKSLGMLHRDVSAENLLVGLDGVTRLTDFGIAKSALSSVVTEEGVVHGKLVYLAPEYLRRENTTRALDVYAMGVTLWIALTGTIPWRDRSGAEVLQAILQEGIPPLSSEGVQVDPVLANIIACACEQKASRRFQTARQMLDALEEYGRTANAVASHVEVAEYVERIVGGGLKARREKIKVQRHKLERELGSMLVAADIELATEEQTVSPAAEPKGPPQASVAFETTANVDQLLRQNASLLRRQWLVYGVVLLVGLGLGYGVFMAGEGTAAPLNPPIQARSKQVQELTGAAERVDAHEKSAERAKPALEPDGRSADGTLQKPASAQPSKPKPARSMRRRGKNRAISTKNPYR